MRDGGGTERKKQGSEKESAGKRKKRKQTDRLWLLLIFLSFFVLGYGIGWLSDRAGVAPDQKNYRTFFAVPVVIGSFFLSGYLHVILHEAGHLAAGLRSGYRFVSFRIGSLLWMKKDGRLCLRRYTIPGTAGQCLLRLPEPADFKHPEFPVSFYNLGGVISNLFFSAMALPLVLLPDIPWLLRTGALCFAVFGFLLAAGNGIPKQIGGIPNDGANAAALKRDPEALYGFWLQLEVNARQSEGLRLRDMPEEWFYLPRKERLSNAFIGASGYLYVMYLRDRGEYARAAEATALLLDEEVKLIPMYREELRCEGLFDELLGRCDPSVLREKNDASLRAYRKKTKSFLSRIRLEYAWQLLVEKDPEKAAACRNEFERKVRRYPFDGEVEAEREAIGRADTFFRSCQEKNLTSSEGNA